MNSAFQSSVYSAATLIAAKLENYFARRLAESPPPNDQQSAHVPDRETIEQLINAAFWTSLQREEGRSPKVSLAYLPPEQRWLTMTFAEPLPLASNALIKLSPGVEFSGAHLGVWRGERNELAIWGGTRSLPPNCFVLEMLEPGLLVVKQNRGSEVGKFVNILILSADQIKEIDENAASSADFPVMLDAMLDFVAANSVDDQFNVPLQLAAQMRKHGHGGSLLVIPQNHSGRWRESVVSPTPYSLSPSFTRLTDLMQQTRETTDQHERQKLLADTKQITEAIAGLTAIDGATVISDCYELLTFGAKIKRRAKSAQVEQVLITEPITGNQPETISLLQYGGTRHLSAAQFVQDQPDCSALVSSQDGRFTVFFWSPAGANGARSPSRIAVALRN